MDCVPIRGTGVRQSIRWEKHDRLPTGAPIRLRFVFRKARLFSFSVVPSNS
jgi:hypothetical protein